MPNRSTRNRLASPPSEDPHRFVRRLKRWALGLTIAGLGIGWGLVSQDAVGASTTTTPHRATLPSASYFGNTAAQPIPIIGGTAPVARSGSS